MKDEQFQKITDEDRAYFQRVLSGEHDAELVSKGAIYATIRELRVTRDALNSLEYQKALSDVQRAIVKLEPKGLV